MKLTTTNYTTLNKNGKNVFVIRPNRTFDPFECEELTNSSHCRIVDADTGEHVVTLLAGDKVTGVGITPKKDLPKHSAKVLKQNLKEQGKSSKKLPTLDELED